MHQEQLQKDTYTTKDLMNLLNVSYVTLYKLIKDGKLTPILMGNKYLFLKKDVESFLNEKQANKTLRKPNYDRSVKKAAK
jgi:excisionase family DNA binding protein